MSLVSWPCRKALASLPVSASLPRSERSTTKVVTDARLVALQAGQPPADLVLELIHHAVARDPGLQRRPHDLRLLGAVEALEQCEEPFEVQWKPICHVRSLVEIMPLAETFNE